MTGRTLAGAVLGALACAYPAAAAGTAELEISYGTKARGAAALLDFTVRYRLAGDDDAKPPAIRRVRIALPAGLRFDTTALPTCDASDDSFRALGTSACDPESKAGTGSLVAATGSPLDPLQADIHVYNGGEELVEVVTAKGTGTVLAVERIAIDANRLSADPTMAPGAPPDGTAVRDIVFTLERGFVLTPPRCPRRRHWRTTSEFAFADGSEATATSRARCRRAKRPLRGRGGTAR